MAIVTSIDRPKSVRDRCVIEVFAGVLVLSSCFLDFSVGVGDFVIGLSQISIFSFYMLYLLRQFFFVRTIRDFLDFIFWKYLGTFSQFYFFYAILTDVCELS